MLLDDENTWPAEIVRFPKANDALFDDWYPPNIIFESGLVNVANFVLAVSNYELWGPIFEDVQVSATINVDSPDTVTEALLKIFNAVYAASGHSRPANG